MRQAPNSLEEFWIPFTSNREFKASPRLISRAEGMTLYNQYDEPVIDGSSGLFCSPAGHCHPKIVEAVHEQMKRNTYTSPFGTGHNGAFDLAAAVTELTPEGMNRVFFANSGSEAIDTALKIVMAYHHARGDLGRTRFVSRDRAYHGVNIGGLSLSGMVRNRRAFPVTLPYVSTIRDTYTGEELGRPGQPETGADRAEDLERLCATYGGESIAAVFVEPVAGSTGVLVPPQGYLQRLREICDKHGILLVFDEVITGFGRTGANFGAHAFGVTPDVMTMAKALTNGSIPMGAVAVKQSIYDAMMDAAPEGAIEFFHGYTYSGHPAATAAGLAMMEIIKEEGLFERVVAHQDHLRKAVHALGDHPAVKDVRSIGFLAAVELHPGPTVGALGGALQTDLFWRGLHVKFTGDTGIVAPPFIAEPADIDRIVEKLRDGLDAMAA